MKTIAFITRVHPQRSEMLKVCIDSVRRQIDNDYIHVIYRDDKTKDGYGIFLANQSLARISFIEARYMMLLDDDNMLINPNFVSMFKKLVNDHNPEIVFYKVVIGNSIFPPPEYWEHPPIRKRIDGHCFAVRMDVWKKYIHEFGIEVCGDYRFISACYKNTTNHYWLDREISMTQRRAGRGKGKSENEDSIC